MKHPAPSQLRELFDYDPETGKLTWRRRLDVGEWWNTRYAGKEITALDRHGYVQVKLRPHTLRAHRIIWALVTGQWPTLDIDHINGSRSDNRWVNLREVTRSQNTLNRHAPRRCRWSRGVTFHKASGLFRAYLNINARQVSFGYHKTPEEAAAAFEAQAPEYLRGEHA